LESVGEDAHTTADLEIGATVWVGAAVLGWRCGFGLALRFWVGAAVLGWRYGFIRHGAETPGWDCGQGDLHDDVRYHDA